MGGIWFSCCNYEKQCQNWYSFMFTLVRIEDKSGQEVSLIKSTRIKRSLPFFDLKTKMNGDSFVFFVFANTM